ncbi:hypothetical protein LTR56_001591 [Elasticomyces elasticus]|nr:hypothetical protein LTR56_001591 [Elasticomyces elasticus]KAK3667357.1 hypothetical protein LTR22_001873 [Elasticomyces elasticus]KAK4932563.1 hypothetical protein LTR49_000987 [Elasticomyces elasticus]KAK5769585.1 hypothetical protein LTS12_000035 [Elasticomyces elasticus]
MHFWGGEEEILTSGIEQENVQQLALQNGLAKDGEHGILREEDADEDGDVLKPALQNGLAKGGEHGILREEDADGDVLKPALQKRFRERDVDGILRDEAGEWGGSAEARGRMSLWRVVVWL